MKKYTNFTNEIQGDPLDNGQFTFGVFILQMAFIFLMVIIGIIFLQ